MHVIQVKDGNDEIESGVKYPVFEITARDFGDYTRDWHTPGSHTIHADIVDGIYYLNDGSGAPKIRDGRCSHNGCDRSYKALRLLRDVNGNKIEQIFEGIAEQRKKAREEKKCVLNPPDKWGGWEDVPLNYRVIEYIGKVEIASTNNKALGHPDCKVEVKVMVKWCKQEKGKCDNKRKNYYFHDGEICDKIKEKDEDGKKIVRYEPLTATNINEAKKVVLEMLASVGS